MLAALWFQAFRMKTENQNCPLHKQLCLKLEPIEIFLTALLENSYFCYLIRWKISWSWRKGKYQYFSLPSLLQSPAPQPRSPCISRTSSVALSPSLSRCLDTSRPLASPSSTLHRQCANTPQPQLSQDSPSSDTGGGCYTELYPSPQSYVARLRAEEGSVGIDPLRAEDRNVYFSPVVETVSSFKPSRYQSSLMPKENKPLEVGILRRVKELLVEVDPRTAAKHITKADCMVLLLCLIFLY